MDLKKYLLSIVYKMAFRNYCYTFNNYVATDVEALKAYACKYHVIGFEVGAEGTKHLQGYIEFGTPKKFNALKNAFPKIHWEKRKGTAKQAADYCKKDEHYWEDGEMSQQGKRSDIAEAVELIQDGNKMKVVAQQYPIQFVKYHKGFKALQSELTEPRDYVPTVTVLYGPTGTGKSKKARELLTDYWVWTPQRGQWFDGYQGEDNVIFEEFRGQMPLGMMLSLLDRYECPVQYKGGTTEFRGRNIVITSPCHPRDWYENSGDDKIDQLLRRISKIEKLTEQVTQVTEVVG